MLRHKPEAIGIRLDAAGWTSVAELLRAAGEHGTPLTRASLREIVETNDKRRFELSPDGERIRASQGHSVSVELGYAPAAPPAILYHGTPRGNLGSIRERGLLRGRRHHVHLSSDAEIARRVGSRRGAPVVLRVRAAAMHDAGHEFFLSANGVWLTDFVPPEFLIFDADAAS